MLDEQTLKQIEERANKATPGPWIASLSDSYCAYPGVKCGNHHFIFEDHHTDECQDKHSENGLPGSDSDAAFIAHARTDIPALIAEVRQFREALVNILVDISNPEINQDLIQTTVKLIREALEGK